MARHATGLDRVTARHARSEMMALPMITGVRWDISFDNVFVGIV